MEVRYIRKQGNELKPTGIIENRVIFLKSYEILLGINYNRGENHDSC